MNEAGSTISRLRSRLRALGKRAWRLAVRRVDAWALPRFPSRPEGLVILRPRRVSNPEHIWIGRDVKLGPNCVLSANTSYPGGWMHHPEGRHVAQDFQPEIRIGDRVTATSGLQLYAMESIVIEEDVMFAANVFLSDGTHSIRDPNVPYKFQGMERIAPIRIGRGSWIGQNVVVMPGVTVGEYAVVGANSVVTRDVPARSVAAGAPAGVVKRWDEASESWVPSSDARGSEG